MFGSFDSFKLLAKLYQLKVRVFYIFLLSYISSMKYHLMIINSWNILYNKMYVSIEWLSLKKIP